MNTDIHMPTRTVHFLVVEDSAVIRTYVRHVLENGFGERETRVLEALDGKSALAAMKTERIDLIVTDLAMEGMDGGSFLHLLKRNGVLARKPVVVLSGLIPQELRDEFKGQSDVAFLSKPANADELIRIAHSLLGTRAPQ
jgi:two-component system chemotaxis response regulator CheY